MNRSLVVRNFASVVGGACVIMVGCTDQPVDVAPNEVTETSSAIHNFCGNNRCDHGETCSTCSQDCGSCTGSGGAGGAGGAGGTGGAGGAGGTGGSGGI